MDKKAFMHQLVEMTVARPGIQIAVICQDIDSAQEYKKMYPDAEIQIDLRNDFRNSVESGIRLWVADGVIDIIRYRGANINVVAFDDMERISALAYQRFSSLARANGEIGMHCGLILQRKIDEYDE